MQNAISIKMWGHRAPRAVLRDLNAALRPRIVRTFVSTIARSTRRAWSLREESCKARHCGIDQSFLNSRGQKVFLPRPFRVPVFKPNPGHAPVDVRNACL